MNCQSFSAPGTEVGGAHPHLLIVPVRPVRSTDHDVSHCTLPTGLQTCWAQSASPAHAVSWQSTTPFWSLSTPSPQWSDSGVQTFCPAQVPALQASPVVHLLPSLQAATLLALTHPFAGSHESSVHALPSSQLTAWPTHLPPLHVSPVVQALASSQAATLLANTQLPVCVSQESSVHTLPSSQIFNAATHLPPPQTSPVVHGLPSSQVAALGSVTHAFAGSHESSVHGFLSSQSGAAPPTHLNAASTGSVPQASPEVHALPSSQACPANDFRKSLQVCVLAA